MIKRKRKRRSFISEHLLEPENKSGVGVGDMRPWCQAGALQSVGYSMAKGYRYVVWQKNPPPLEPFPPEAGPTTTRSSHSPGDASLVPDRRAPRGGRTQLSHGKEPTGESR